jgi:hypothetical protein
MTYAFFPAFLLGQHGVPEPSYQKVERLFKSIITNMRGQVKRLLNEFSYFFVMDELFPFCYTSQTGKKSFLGILQTSAGRLCPLYPVLSKILKGKGLGIVCMFCYTPFGWEKKMISYKRVGDIEAVGIIENGIGNLRLTFGWVYNKVVKDFTKRSHERGSQIHG